MKKTLFAIVLLAFVGSAIAIDKSKIQYTGVDDPKLIQEAKRRLHERYPSLTENDLENLSGIEADRILNGGKSPEKWTG